MRHHHCCCAWDTCSAFRQGRAVDKRRSQTPRPCSSHNARIRQDIFLQGRLVLPWDLASKALRARIRILYLKGYRETGHRRVRLVRDHSSPECRGNLLHRTLDYVACCNASIAFIAIFFFVAVCDPDSSATSLNSSSSSRDQTGLHPHDRSLCDLWFCQCVEDDVDPLYVSDPNMRRSSEESSFFKRLARTFLAMSAAKPRIIASLYS